MGTDQMVSMHSLPSQSRPGSKMCGYTGKQSVRHMCMQVLFNSNKTNEMCSLRLGCEEEVLGQGLVKSSTSFKRSALAILQTAFQMFEKHFVV